MSDVDPSDDRLTFVGTATVLLRCGGFTILTDPNFLHQGDHAHLGWGLRSRRLTQPAMEIGDLPPLDLIVLSHHHGDHFDEVATRATYRRRSRSSPSREARASSAARGLIHLGGTRIAGVLLTMDAEPGVRTLQLIAPRRAIPIHVDDYTVFESPLADFRAAVDASDLATEIIYVDRGETIVPPPRRP